MLQSDYGADRCIVPEPGMVTNLIELHPLLRIRLEQLGDEIFGDARETPRPLNPLMQDVIEELLLVLADKGRIPS